jgi:hypothetical protein
MTAITNIEDFDPERVDGVESPANGVNKFLILKASGELAEDVGKSSSFNAEDRRKYASNGVALPDGSYPIPDVKHLKLAIGMVGLGKRPKKEIRAHIERRARALGRTDLIPKDWSKKVAKEIPESGDGRGSLNSTDFMSRVNEALAAVQASLDELKQKDMLGGGPADPDPSTASMAKELEELRKMVEAKQPKIDADRKEDSTGLAGAEKETGGRTKDGKFVSRKKYKADKAALKAYRKKEKAEKKVDTDPSVKSVEKSTPKKPPRSTSFQGEDEVIEKSVQEGTPAELVKKNLNEQALSPMERARLGREATGELISDFAKSLNLFPVWFPGRSA